MERLVYQPDCGCQVYRIMHSKPNLYRIQYCPLHKSAPDLYEALKVAHRELLHAQWEDGLDKIEEALAKAEGNVV